MKAEVQYFRVVNLEKYQHYTKRNPPWIKLHASTLEDYDFARLQDASKMHLCAIWLLASRTDNKIPYDAEWIAKRINATADVDLAALEHAGFIEVIGYDSNTLAPRTQSAAPETEDRERVREQRTETDPPKPPAHKLADVPDGFTKFWEAYPRNAMGRKVGKQAALNRWKKLRPSPDRTDQIIAALATQTAQHHWQNAKGEDYVPNPATWLNEGRWDDELAPPPETSEQSRERAIDEHQVSRRYGRPLKADIAELDKMIETASTNDYLGLASLEAHRQNLIEELDESKENQHERRNDQEPTPSGAGADRPA